MALILFYLQSLFDAEVIEAKQKFCAEMSARNAETNTAE